MKRLVLALAAITLALPAAAQLRAAKRADLAKPVVLGPGQAALVIGFRRSDKMSEGKAASATFARFDMDKHDLVFQPRHAKKDGDTKTYWVEATSTGAMKANARDFVVMIVSEGDYALFAAFPSGPKQMLNTFCLGAPVFHVGAGEAVYFGDMTPYPSVRLVDGTRTAAMAYGAHFNEAREALKSQPALAALKPADLKQSTYGCAGQLMAAYVVPGASELPPIAPLPANAPEEAPVDPAPAGAAAAGAAPPGL